jgi:epoxyqueuosine reductase
LDWLGGINEAEFNRLFNGSPIRRAGWNGLQRNIAIAMANSGLKRFLPQLRKWAESEEELSLKKTARWAMQKLEKPQSRDSSDRGDNGLPCASAKEDRHS